MSVEPNIKSNENGSNETKNVHKRQEERGKNEKRSSIKNLILLKEAISDENEVIK